MLCWHSDMRFVCPALPNACRSGPGGYHCRSFNLATQLSLITQFEGGLGILYLPFALGLVTVLWWGPRVLWALYAKCGTVHAAVGADWHQAPLHAAPETLGVACCYLLLRWRAVRCRLPDIIHVLRFILFGVLIPQRHLPAVDRLPVAARRAVRGAGTAVGADALSGRQPHRAGDFHPPADLPQPLAAPARLADAATALPRPGAGACGLRTLPSLYVLLPCWCACQCCWNCCRRP